MIGNVNPIGNPVITSSEEQTSENEFRRFEDAPRKLVQTPKPEQDKQPDAAGR